jgi:hypothetical protein
LPLKSTRGITGTRTYCLGNSESGAEAKEFEAVNGRFATGSDLRDRCALSLLSQRHLRVIPLPRRPRGYCYASSRGELPYDEEKSREDSLPMTPKTRNSGGLIVARKSNPCELFGRVRRGMYDTEGCGMEWHLRNEPVLEGQAENGAIWTRQAKQEEIPI